MFPCFIPRLIRQKDDGRCGGEITSAYLGAGEGLSFFLVSLRWREKGWPMCGVGIHVGLSLTSARMSL